MIGCRVAQHLTVLNMGWDGRKEWRGEAGVTDTPVRTDADARVGISMARSLAPPRPLALVGSIAEVQMNTLVF